MTNIVIAIIATPLKHISKMLAEKPIPMTTKNVTIVQNMPAKIVILWPTAQSKIFTAIGRTAIKVLRRSTKLKVFLEQWVSAA